MVSTIIVKGPEEIKQVGGEVKTYPFQAFDEAGKDITADVDWSVDGGPMDTRLDGSEGDLVTMDEKTGILTVSCHTGLDYTHDDDEVVKAALDGIEGSLDIHTLIEPDDQPVAPSSSEMESIVAADNASQAAVANLASKLVIALPELKSEAAVAVTALEGEQKLLENKYNEVSNELYFFAHLQAILQSGINAPGPQSTVKPPVRQPIAPSNTIPAHSNNGPGPVIPAHSNNEPGPVTGNGNINEPGPIAGDGNVNEPGPVTGDGDVNEPGLAEGAEANEQKNGEIVHGGASFI